MEPITSDSASPQVMECMRKVEEYYEVVSSERYSWGAEIILGAPRRVSRGYKEALYRDLVRRGCKPFMRPTEKGLTLRIVTDKDRGQALLKGALLAAATIVTVYLSGEWLASAPGPRGAGFSWSPYGYLVGLLLPLIIHELGHWSVMRRYNVPSSIPYLIPAPPLQMGFLGTLGAVINLRWLPPSRDSLALMAVMGPLAGFIASIPFTIIGIKASILEPSSAVPGAAQLNLAPAAFIILASIYAPEGGGVLLLSPLAYASYVVLLVTFLNLIPVAMLDGGHIIRSAVGERTHRAISQASILVLLIASMFYPAFFMFALLAMVIYFLARGRHPGPAMDEGGMGPLGVFSIIVYGVLLALTVPIPV